MATAGPRSACRRTSSMPRLRRCPIRFATSFTATPRRRELLRRLLGPCRLMRGENLHRVFDRGCKTDQLGHLRAGETLRHEMMDQRQQQVEIIMNMYRQD